MSWAALQRRKLEMRERERHRSWYWSHHDRDSYACPDCGCTIESTRQFDVHHKDHNPLNGDPQNLVALCFECHLARHDKERHRTLEEWKADFQALGGGSV